METQSDTVVVNSAVVDMQEMEENEHMREVEENEFEGYEEDGGGQVTLF